MSDWYYFWRGLAGAFSWEKGQDNALIGGEPSWTYLLGLSIHFLVILGLFGLVLFGFYKTKVQAGSWKAAFGVFWDNLFLRGRVRGILGLVFGFPIIFIAIPFYAGYRMTNGVWRYNYFTNQETVTKTVLLSELDTYVGSRKSGSSSITLTVFNGNEKRTVNIANSSQTLARTLKSELKTPTMIDVEVNKEGQIIFVH